METASASPPPPHLSNRRRFVSECVCVRANVCTDSHCTDYTLPHHHRRHHPLSSAAAAITNRPLNDLFKGGSEEGAEEGAALCCLI